MRNSKSDSKGSVIKVEPKKMVKAPKTTAELFGWLITAAQQVRNGEIDHKQAGAISSLTRNALQVGKLNLDFTKLSHEVGGKKKVLRLLSMPIDGM